MISPDLRTGPFEVTIASDRESAAGRFTPRAGSDPEVALGAELLPGATDWTPRRALARAVSVLREEGARAAWFKVVGEIGYRRLRILERDTAAPLPDVPVVEGADLLEDAAELAGFRPSYTLERIERRLARGELCFVARHRGRIVSVTWAAPGRAAIPYLGCVWRGASDEDVFLSETLTLPAFRRRGFAFAIARAQIEYYRVGRVRRLVSGVLPENRASLRARAKVGYRPCGWAISVGFGSRRVPILRLRGPDRGWALERLG